MTTAGANFCYTRPEDFIDDTAGSTYPNSDGLKTAISYRAPGGVGDHDSIFVTSRNLPINTDTMDDSTLFVNIEDTNQVGTNGITAKTDLRWLTVDGLRALETTLTFDNGTRGRLVNVFKADSRVAVLCEWKKFERPIAAGCERVLRSLQVIAL